MGHGECVGQRERLQTPPSDAIELVHVRAIFVRDEHTFTVPRDANALRIEAGIGGIG